MAVPGVLVQGSQLVSLPALQRLHRFARSNGSPIFSQYGSDAASVLEAVAAHLEG
jgi:hypothetical protein